jgi:hypothetical protein
VTSADAPRHVLRRMAIDLTPLRESPDYGRVLAGSAVSQFGEQMTVVAVPVQVYALTRSSLAVGMIGLAVLGPLILFGLAGGAIADAMDRRRLALITSAGMAVLSALLVVQAVAHLDQVWLLYVIVAVQAGLGAVDSPTKATFVPRLLPARSLPAAGALQGVTYNISTTGGPLVAGTVIAVGGLATAYLVDALSFGAALYAIARLGPMAPDGGGRRAGMTSVLEGLQFLRTRPVVLMTFLVDINAMVFGMPRALFPALAATVFAGGAPTVGLLYAAPAFGALLGALLSGWCGAVRRQGLGVLLAVAAWGVAITLFGLTRTLWVGVVLLAVAGAADMVSGIWRMAILQVCTPDELRGRLNGVSFVVVAGGPGLGDVESGMVAVLSTPTFAVLSGGLACVAGVGLLAALVPRFARYDARAVPG